MASDKYVGQFRPEFSRLYRDADLPWLIPLPSSMVVAVVGDRLSGKTMVASYLEQRHGFRLFRVQDYVREVGLRRGVPVDDRLVLRQFADGLRAERNDPAFLAGEVVRRARRRLLAEASPGSIGPPIVVSGLRHDKEVALLRPMRMFHLVRVQAPPERRLGRALTTGRLRPGSTLQDLDEQLDQPEREGVESRYALAMRGRMRLLVEDNAGAPVVDNDCESRDELRLEVERVLQELRAAQRLRG
jgi:dephospho-CoA kinase